MSVFCTLLTAAGASSASVALTASSHAGTLGETSRPSPVNRLRWIAQDIVSGASRLFRATVKSIWPLAKCLLVGFLFCFCYLGATLGALLAFTLAFTAHGILAGLLALCLAMSVGVVLLQCMSEHF